MNEIKTQGSLLYMVDAITTTDPTLRKFVCPTGISGFGGAADKYETTCLEETEAKTYIGGLEDPGTISVPFNLRPEELSHQILFRMKADRTETSWLALLSDGVTLPTVLDSDDVIVPPTGRSSLGFFGYISDVSIDIATNTIVKGTLTIQRSGAITETWKS